MKGKNMKSNDAYKCIVQLMNDLNSIHPEGNLNIVSRMFYDKIVPSLYSTPDFEDELRLSLFDYTRYRTLELLIYEIKRRNLKGETAEVGVYQGLYSRYINSLLPQKKLYLFDTFNGFSSAQINKEVNNNFLKKSFLDIVPKFKNTSVEKVIGTMPYPNSCIIKKGHFPDTAKDIKETFCLVSIDVDLYESTKAALVFFAPRLEKYGYLIVHDYNQHELFGVKAAVNEFLDENPSFCCVPITDQCGSIIITF